MNNNNIITYYFNSEIWDAPEIVNSEGNVIDTLNVGEKMYSWMVIKGKVYVSYEKSHYGAIEVALMNIHHLENIKQIEKKFGESIDDICEEIRYSKQNECEGRFWCKYNLIEVTGRKITHSYIQQLCQQVGVNINNIYIIGAHQDNTPYDYFPIIKYTPTLALNESLMQEEENIGGFDNSIKFKATIPWISKMYAKANEELFGGSLGDCIFKAEPITSHTYWLGMFSFSNMIKGERRSRLLYIEKTRFGNYGGYDKEKIYIDKNNFFEYCKPTITMNTLYSGTEFSLYCTLVHEMCHYYTYMRGRYPYQAHGPEFKRIGEAVQWRSNNVITVARLANAEQMSGYEVDADVQAARDRREENKAKKMEYIFVFRKDGEIRLVSTALSNVINSILVIDGKKGNTIIRVTNQELKNALYKDGYRKALRHYAYYLVDTSKMSYKILQTILANKNNYETLYQGEVQI